MPRQKAHKTERLGVFMNGILVGHLERQDSGALSFVYAPSWLEEAKPIQISRQLPLQEKPFVGQPVRNYFDNLLPDDDRIREQVAAQASASGTQPFDLLSAVGRDCVGALQFYPEGSQPGPVVQAKGRTISDAEISKIIRDLRINPLGINKETDFRISLAGAQSKTALLWIDGKWSLPEGPTPTTHILKPAIGVVPDGPDLTLSVENEWLCLKFMKAFNVPTADAEIKDFEGTRVIVVKRFDCEWSGKKLFRLPQEDLCQALGVGPEKKYESHGGPGIEAILSLLNESDQRDEDRKIFMKTQLIFWLLAAIDGHGKNFSIFLRPGGFVMTPIYDVMSADPHNNPSTLPMQKIKLAMAVGDNRHYKVEEIFPRHWYQTAKKYKYSDLEELIQEIVQTAPKAIELVRAELPKSFPATVSDPIFHAIADRVKKLAEPKTE